ncbi:MAG: type II 3-dehydroquinate dehydratase, partial [Aeromicrobium sp.]
VRQTDDEAEMIGWLHEAADTRSPVVLNAGAWTHTSVAVRDAASQLTEPLIEVHLSNVHAREPFRHTSYISDIAAAVVVGMGLDGYAAALRHLGSDSGGS